MNEIGMSERVGLIRTLVLADEIALWMMLFWYC